MNATVQIFPDAQAAAEACAQTILDLLNARLNDSAQASLAISGGSTPRLLFDCMSRLPFDWTRIQIFWVDERAVPPDDSQSNYKLANDHLLQPAGVPAANVHRIRSELPPEQAALYYAQEIRDALALGPRELPCFDVVHQGMGPDAHTASLFPGEPFIEDRGRIAAAVYVAKIAAHRITLLPAALLNARHTLMLVAGDDKAEPLKTVLDGDYDPLQHPAQLIARKARDVRWFVDAPAARLLPPLS